MNNSNNCVDIDKINSQLERADIQKSRLISNIYREYELYLNLVRELLYISVEKGVNELCNKENYFNANELFCLFEKKLSRIIYDCLPLLTVEQLRINKKINEEINFKGLGCSGKTKDVQKEKVQFEDGLQIEEPIQFEISEDIFNTSEYYQGEFFEKLESLDFDNNDLNNYSSNQNIIENLGVEKKLISSLLELIHEVTVEIPRYSEKDNINQIGISPKHQSLKNFELIDRSLEDFLLNFSYKINQELFKANLIKKMISKDSFEYLVRKKLMIKHTRPFVINLELNINQSSFKSDNTPSIFFFNISTVELEFKNLNLSIQRNNIIDLKNQFQRLIKKETYWRQKEITLNKIR